MFQWIKAAIGVVMLAAVAACTAPMTVDQARTSRAVQLAIQVCSDVMGSGVALKTAATNRGFVDPLAAVRRIQGFGDIRADRELYQLGDTKTPGLSVATITEKQGKVCSMGLQTVSRSDARTAFEGFRAALAGSGYMITRANFPATTLGTITASRGGKTYTFLATHVPAKQTGNFFTPDALVVLMTNRRAP